MSVEKTESPWSRPLIAENCEVRKGCTREEILKESTRCSDEKDGKNIPFIVGKLLGAESQKFILSKYLVKLASEEFASLISREEATLGGWSNCIYIMDIQPHIFENIVQYIYLQPAWRFDGNYVNAFNLLQAARKFKLWELNSIISEQVPLFSMDKNSFVDFGTACSILNESRLRADKDLRDVVLGYICKNAASVFEHDSFLRLSTSSICDFLKMDQICVSSELDIFKALMRWGLARCKLDHRRGTSANFQEILEAPIQLIRFMNMSDFEFDEYVLPVKVLRPHQVNILKEHRILQDIPRLARAELFRTTFELKVENWSLSLGLLEVKRRQLNLEKTLNEMLTAWNNRNANTNQPQAIEGSVTPATTVESTASESVSPSPTGSTTKSVLSLEDAPTLLLDMNKPNACVVEISNQFTKKLTNGMFYCYNYGRSYHAMSREVRPGHAGLFSFYGNSKVSGGLSYRIGNSHLVISYCLRAEHGELWIGFAPGNIEITRAIYDQLRNDYAWHQKPDYKHVQSRIPNDDLCLCIEKGALCVTVSTKILPQAVIYVHVSPCTHSKEQTTQN